MAPLVAILATLDTKADESDFLAACFAASGVDVRVIDTGTAGGRHDVDDVIAHTQTTLRELVASGTLGGVIALGGGRGSWTAAQVLRALPLGLPKMLVSTQAHRASGLLVGTDIVFVPAITDIAGINPILGPILSRAAAALIGMVTVGRPAPDGRPAVAMTMFGVTTAGGDVVRTRLTEAGYLPVVFHANGAGGAAMEEFIGRNAFCAVLDWTTTELADEVAGGECSAGPDRLRAAGAVGIPQVVVPGAIDVISLPAERIDDTQGAGRVTYRHTPLAMLLRTSGDELVLIAADIAAKLNAATGPVHVLIPERGFSALDVEGGPFGDPSADRVFIDALGDALRQDIPMTVLPNHINDPAFAETASGVLVDMLSSSVTADQTISS